MHNLDPFWERLHVAYELEAQKRSTYIQNTSPTLFEPGEIAYSPGLGVTSTYYRFLKLQGYRLTKEELFFDKQRHPSRGKYCLVIQRLRDGSYLVCPLTTVGRLGVGADIPNPALRFFAVAIGTTPEWPPGVQPIATYPTWRGNGFLFGAPIRRTKLIKPNLYVRAMLRAGELDRVKKLLVEKIKSFRKEQATLRAEAVRWTNLVYSSGGLSAVEFLRSDEAMSLKNSEQLRREERYFRGGLDQPINKRPRKRRPVARAEMPRIKPVRISYISLEPEGTDLRYPLRHMPDDIMQVSPGLARLREQLATIHSKGVAEFQMPSRRFKIRPFRMPFR
ncbi:hypothetical protein JAAARDRAFT_709778 [Jaapia argillacea MUCL 33604]|uniref:Uncharacterized protein n=1 Tax=Jaapia argillacea MUCL 33604 TaxID=933084 RepID=A0A067Q2B9_9AGAM|nr:hypothetical protein JAAARDRAFT_709778 [Jaapia argillacea MUCL 33604]